MRNLTKNHKQAWKHLFKHFVFQENGEPLAHLQPQQRGILSKLTPQSYNYIKQYLISILKREGGRR